jgi:hypothetical protein
MNTKTFAQESRKILMQGVAKKLLYWGFNDKGEILEQPEKVSGGYSFRGEVFDDPSVPNLWHSLQVAIKNKGIEVVVEEAAYTWFNRIMALRILVKNGYEEPQLEDAKGLEHTPIILQKARQGRSDFLNADEKTRLQNILSDYSKDQEAFAILIKGYCHSHKTLQRVFGKIDDYTELLLPDNMLQTDGFLQLLNTTDAISDDEYQKVELIGWLYQFYISEKKDEVFASFKKKKKAEAKDIPAATQIFTPNWIVKYMVENTAGKIWLDKHPNSALKTQMKYLVINDVIASDSEAISPLINTIEDLTLIDPAAGSGHILVEGFDLIYKMYLEEYYTPEEAVESILKNNLFGLDIDDRAAQLATFAILLKAAKVYPVIWKKEWLPNVYAMPEAADFSEQEIKDFLSEEGTDYVDELEAALHLMKQAKNLGSVMKLSLSGEAKTFIEQQFIAIKNTEFRDFNIEAIYQKLAKYIPILLLLTKKYTSVVANPPYLYQRKMNANLKQYCIHNYPKTKSDLFAVFMEVLEKISQKNGLRGIINQHSWMFTASFDTYRDYFLKNLSVVNLLHLGPRTFEELGGEVVQSVALVFTEKNKLLEGVYYKLNDYRDVFKKEEAFLLKKNRFSNINQNSFKKIPKYPFCYWGSSKFYEMFSENLLENIAEIKVGIDSGNNKEFLRNWYEVSTKKTNLNAKSGENNSGKWFPYNKGGEFRKWYGNKDYLLNWENNGEAVIKTKNSNIRSKHLQFHPSLSWSLLAGSSFGVRYFKKGFLFDNNGRSIIFKNQKDDSLYFKYLNSYLNSKLSYHFLSALNPTLAFQVGDLKRLPFRFQENNVEIEVLGLKCQNISKKDWDSRETSWDFEQSSLINNTSNLEAAYIIFQKEVTKDFFQLHTNEEELNRVFIDIYGLQDELTPEVALKDVTILQEELNKKDLEKLEVTFREEGANEIELPINKAEVISQFISYAIGLFMGRYRLDKPGLNIAHPNPTAAELASYVIARNEAISSSENENKITIDEDAILPIMGTACNFPDDALQQVYNLLDVIWGSETRTENINFIQDCLNKELEKFLVVDFYKYHCKMYKKKPIYWLFASKKGAFKVLVYMHRMNAFTVEKIRDNYLLEHIKNIVSEITMLENNEANLNTQEAKKLEQLRKNRDECYEYEAELKTVADNQITFDLDDGVTVNYKKFETVVAKIK